MSPTQRTLKLLRDSGYHAGVVERWTGRVRKDLFNIIDIIAIDNEKTLGVQSCGTDFAGHAAKMTVEYREETLRWLGAPGRGLLLVGWRRVASYKKDGSRAVRDAVKPRVMEIVYRDETLWLEATDILSG